jgi:hypothetical protein
MRLNLNISSGVKQQRLNIIILCIFVSITQHATPFFFAPHCVHWRTNCLAVPYFLQLSRKQQKKVFPMKCVFRSSLQCLSEMFFSFREGFSKILSVHVNCQIFLSDFKETNISRQILIKFPNTEFHENLYSGSPVFPCRRTDGRTDKTNLTVAFCQLPTRLKLLTECNILYSTIINDLLLFNVSL